MQYNTFFSIISDAHFGQKAHSKGVFLSQMQFFHEQFFPYLLKNNIKTVFHLGDLTHNRNVIDLWILQELKTQFFSFFEKNKITFYTLLGNHDIVYRNSLSHSFPKENLNEFEYVKVIDEPTKVSIGKYTIGLMPWIVDLKNYSLPDKCDILMGHFDIQSMPMLTNIMSHEGHLVDEFKSYKHVFSGHYHIKSDKDNIHYVGTQYQLSWNDFDQTKGFYVVRDNYQFEYIENVITPRFMKIYYKEIAGDCEIRLAGDGDERNISKLQAIELAKKNYLKVFVEKCSNQIEFDRFYDSLLIVSKNDYKIEIVNSEEIIEDYDFSDFDTSLESETSTVDLIMSYIESMVFTDDIDKQLLLDLSRKEFNLAAEERKDI